MGCMTSLPQSGHKFLSDWENRFVFRRSDVAKPFVCGEELACIPPFVDKPTPVHTGESQSTEECSDNQQEDDENIDHAVTIQSSGISRSSV